MHKITPAALDALRTVLDFASEEFANGRCQSFERRIAPGCIPDDEPDEMDQALTLARETVDALGSDKPLHVILGLEGGIVQGGWSTGPVDVTVFDYDTEGADEKDVLTVPQDNGETARACIGGGGILVRPDFVAIALEEVVRQQSER